MFRSDSPPAGLGDIVACACLQFTSFDRCLLGTSNLVLIVSCEGELLVLSVAAHRTLSIFFLASLLSIYHHHRSAIGHIWKSSINHDLVAAVAASSAPCRRTLDCSVSGGPEKYERRVICAFPCFLLLRFCHGCGTNAMI